MSKRNDSRNSEGAAGLQCFMMLGGAAAVAWGIYILATRVQPALVDVDGISHEGANWITAGIFFLGGSELACAAGMCAAGVTACSARGLYESCKCLFARPTETGSPAGQAYAPPAKAEETIITTNAVNTI